MTVFVFQNLKIGVQNEFRKKVQPPDTSSVLLENYEYKFIIEMTPKLVHNRAKVRFDMIVFVTRD